ncbi:MAG: NIPSNAP family protein [Planctomycetes bacterium]|nr:NIPSNAP family protein [Planctomycetota bacterium]
MSRSSLRRAPLAVAFVILFAAPYLASRLAPAGAEPAAEPAAARAYGEWRIRIKPDMGAQYVQLIAEKGLPLFRESGGRMVGWWTTLVGNLYEHVTIWEYDGMAGFEKQVAALGKDERFARFVALRDPLLSGEDSRFLRLVPFAEKPSVPEPAKLVVHEIHRVPLGRMERYLGFAKESLPVLKRHKLRPVGPWRADVGRWSEVTYLFLFESLSEREKLIEEFSATGDAAAYGARLAELAEDVSTRILVPAPFAR